MGRQNQKTSSQKLLANYLQLSTLTALVGLGIWVVSFDFALASGLNLAAPGSLTKVWSGLSASSALNIPESEISNWQGQSKLITSSLLAKPLSPQKLIADSLGMVLPSAQTLTLYNYSLDQVYNYVRGLEKKINQSTQEPVLIISNNRATTFVPPRPGIELDSYQTTLNILAALGANESTAELALNTVPPSQALSNTNDLGINELVATGVSSFAGSPQNRRHNIQVGVEKMQGLIIPKGGIFSFDDNLGPVDGEHGFLPELVIKKEGTVPEFGGGLCQVSTTTFRAAINAGVPITQRKNHAYAVSYYSPQGTDATIYPGAVDLKFINNTPGSLLIWPYFADNNILVFDFYGTKDGRQVVVKAPIQYDQKPDGSLKATWERNVTISGETQTDIFKSVYLSPALFHKVEQFVPTSTPVTTNPN